MNQFPPIFRHAPPRAVGSGRRTSRRQHWRAVMAVGLLAVAAGCARLAPATPTPASADPPSAFPVADPGLDGLLVATGGALLVTEADGGLIAFEPAVDHVAAVTAAAGVIVAIDGSGQAAVLDTRSTPDARWKTVDLPTDPQAPVRLAAMAPSGSQLAIVAGDPQGTSFAVTILDLTTGASRTIPARRGLNGPPSWLGPDTIAVDVIRDAGHSGIATIDVASGVLTDGPGPGTIVISSSDGAHLALDDPATGDVLLGDVATWQSGALASMTRIHGPPATGVEALAMSADGTRLAVVRRSDAGASVEIVVRVGDEWRSAQTLTRLGDVPPSVAWLE